MIAEHFEALEADFQREYGLDLRECLWGEHPLGGRRLAALVRWIVPPSALHHSVEQRPESAREARQGKTDPVALRSFAGGALKFTPKRGA